MDAEAGDDGSKLKCTCNRVLRMVTLVSRLLVLKETRHIYEQIHVGDEILKPSPAALG